ncbi:tyrosine-type recombinase/integrase [Nocardioides sp. T5]|uniref:tyrosine-type recombinase/integrase n=1 Tax=Nocardioides sp. T5 TaxID=3400182 RepID=UPI003A8AE290
MGASEPVASTDELSVLIARTAQLYSDGITVSTRQTYARRWKLFTAWCVSKSLCPLPADPETVMLYLADAAGERSDGAALATLRGWVAAINRLHVEAGYAPPGDDPAMAMFLRTLRRVAPPRSPSEQVTALRIGFLREVCRRLDDCPADPVELRDRVVLCLHRAGLSDGAIARLRWEDVVLSTRRVVIRVESARAGHSGHSVRIGAHRNRSLCAVSAFQQWRDVSGATAEWVVTPVDRHGAREDRPWRAKPVFSIRRSRRESLGGDVDHRIALLGGVPSEVLRDKGLLLLGFAGAFRRPDLCQLRWSDITFKERGAIVRLRRSKTDPEGHGVDVGIPNGTSDLTCPVTALRRWRERVGLQLGADAVPDLPCFTRVGRAGRIGIEPLSTSSVTSIVRRRMTEAGIDGRWGGRSLRRGFISTAADLGVPLEDIARQSRHATLDSLVLYISTDDPLRNNPVSQLGI